MTPYIHHFLYNTTKFTIKNLATTALLACPLWTLSNLSYAINQSPTAQTTLNSMAYDTNQALTQTPTSDYQTVLAKATALAKQKNLAEHRTWRRLLYYPEVATKKQPMQSRVVNRFNSSSQQAMFFISPTGATDPNAELDAMLKALFDPTIKGDMSAQCRFPARTHWLQSRLNIKDSDLPIVQCDKFNAWFEKIRPETASIVFASEYFENPASAFAHSFLKFDNDDGADEYYLNYTPKTTDGEPFLKFAYKSTIAGNAGIFDILNYQQNIDDYKDKQGRDIWQYRLNLTTEQVQQLARAMYEIKEQILPYYLLDDNCASEILVLLNTLFPKKDLLAGMSVSIAPAQIVRRLSETGLIVEDHFEPSRVSQEQARLNAQTATVNHSLTTADANHVNTMTTNHKILPNFSQFAAGANNSNPLLAVPLSRVDTGIGYRHYNNQHDDNFLQLGYRLVYHDALDRPEGYPIGQELTAAAAALRIATDNQHSQDRVQLDHATLIQLRSLKPINTAKSAASWGADIGLQQVQDGLKDVSEDHLVGNIKFEYGKSIAYGNVPVNSSQLPPNVCYGLGTVASQVGKGLTHGFRVGIGANLGCLHQFSANTRGIAELSLPYWLSGDSNQERYWQPKLSLGAQYDLNQKNAFRLTGSRQWTEKKAHNQNDKLLTGLLFSYLHYYD